jgi:hypothetical protein
VTKFLLNNRALGLTEGFNAKINKRQVGDKISFEQLGPGLGFSNQR